MAGWAGAGAARRAGSFFRRMPGGHGAQRRYANDALRQSDVDGDVSFSAARRAARLRIAGGACADGGAVVNARMRFGDLVEVFAMLERGVVLKCAVIP